MTKKTSRILALAMLLAAVIFLFLAFSHPEASFPWSNTITWSIYFVYFILMILFFIAPFRKK